MKLSDFFYELPVDLIAQHPLEQRDCSRLLCLNKLNGEINHRIFSDITDFFEPDDCLILNNSRVIPARLFAVNNKKYVVEIFLLHAVRKNVWECLVKPGKKAKIGEILYINEIKIKIIDVLENGNRLAEFIFDNINSDIYDMLEKIGNVPLPPYIHEKLENSERKKTVYAEKNGSVAAPTAGLHFTPELLEKLKQKGVKIGYVTLHVGLGTFRPVKVENPLEHKMHSENYFLPNETAELINTTKKLNKKITAVGTTVCRVLETVGMPMVEQSGETDIFIYPGYEFKVIDRLITNFHLPESTLIMLVSAFSEREKIMNAYNEAIKEKYRFFSFGDAMFIY